MTTLVIYQSSQEHVKTRKLKQPCYTPLEPLGAVGGEVPVWAVEIFVQSIPLQQGVPEPGVGTRSKRE